MLQQEQHINNKRKRTVDIYYIVYGNINCDMKITLSTFDALHDAIEYINKSYNSYFYYTIEEFYENRKTTIYKFEPIDNGYSLTKN